MHGHTASSHRQRGMSLIDALVAFLVLALGMIAIARLQGHLRLDVDVSRQRSEAVRLAQQDLESLRGFATVHIVDSRPAFDAIASAVRTVDSGTAYTIGRDVMPTDMPHARSITVTVSWTDRSGTRQQFALHSIITGIDPALSGALTLRPH